MNCPTCQTLSAFVDHEILYASNGYPVINVLFYCGACQVCWSRRFGPSRHKNPEFVKWAVSDIKKKCAPTPDRFKFKTERGFVL